MKLYEILGIGGNALGFGGGSGSSTSAFASGGTTANVIPKSNGSSLLADSPLLAPDANTVQQANTTNVQAFYVYGTTDSNATPTNYERLGLTYNLAAQSRFNIAVQKGGTGTLRDIDITTNAAVGFVDGGGTRRFQINTSTGAINQYNNIAAAGIGLTATRASARSTAQAAAVASVATYTPIADQSLEVSANVLVTTATTHSFTVTCTYTDEGNTARTVTLPFVLVAGSAIVNTIVNTNGAVPYLGMPIHIRAKAATAVTIATTGTFTTVAYNVEGSIRQIA